MRVADGEMVEAGRTSTVSIQQDGRRVLSNSLALGSSLVVTFAVAASGQILVRRVLGADRFGVLSFIESISLLVACSFSLGVDSYIRREVAIRHAHALEFARPLAWLRVAMSLVVATVCAVGFAIATGSGERVLLVFVYVIAQGALAQGQTGQAYLHAVERVGGLTISSIATKFAWLGLLVAGLLGPSPLFAAPFALLISETFRSTWLHRLFVRHIGHPDASSRRATTRVVRAATPYYVDSINLSLTNNIIPAVLGLFAAGESHQEVGFLTTAQLAMSAPMFAVPILIWVLNPLFARLRDESAERLWRLVPRVIDRMIVPTGIVAVATAGIAVWLVTTVFGEDYRATALPLVMLSISMPLTYVAVALAGALVADGRAWSLTRVNLVVMVLQTAAAFVIFPIVGDHRPGHPALWASGILVLFELMTAVWLWHIARIGVMRLRTLVEVIALCGAFVLVVVAEYGVASGPTLLVGIAITVGVAATELRSTLGLLRMLRGGGPAPI